MRPLIVTLQLDENAQQFFQTQRQKYFPPAINYIGAHLTLFHQLPGSQVDQLIATCAKLCVHTAPFDVEVASVMKLGRGVAYKIVSDALMALRADLAAAFAPVLVAQDKQAFRPHITVQNKVSAAQAQGLFDHLHSHFEPFSARAEGLQCWWYEGGNGRAGTWSPAAAIAFQKDD